MKNKQYIRFGEIPKDEKSAIHNSNGEKVIGYEIGVSVYNCYKIDDEYRIVIPRTLSHTTLDTLHGFIYDKKQAYIVSGKEVGTGSDNEPLITDCKIEHILPRDYFSYDYKDIDPICIMTTEDYLCQK